MKDAVAKNCDMIKNYVELISHITFQEHGISPSDYKSIPDDAAQNLVLARNAVDFLEEMNRNLSNGDTGTALVHAFSCGASIGGIPGAESQSLLLNALAKLSRGNEAEWNRIKTLRAEKLSYQKVAWKMDEEFPKPNGEKWTPAQVKSRCQYKRKKGKN